MMLPMNFAIQVAREAEGSRMEREKGKYQGQIFPLKILRKVAQTQALNSLPG